MKVLKTSLILLFTLIMQQAWACSCMEPPVVDKALQAADVVVTGIVVDIEKDISYDVNENGDTTFNFHMSITVVLEVETVYKTPKGCEITTKTIRINTASSSAACGYHFQKGGKYIVYANTSKDDNTLWTNLCTRTKHFQQKEADELDKLSKK